MIFIDDFVKFYFILLVGLFGKVVAQQSCGAVMGDGYVGSTFPSCSRCAAGTYAIAFDESCTPCPANSFSVSGSGSCQCNNGYGQVGIGKTLSCTSLCSSNNQVFYSNTCPSGYTYYASTGSCYMYVSVAKTWSDANTACNSNGRGYLVTINSQTEDNLVYFTFGTGARWIGYNDQILEGTYVWAHGASSYTHWASALGQPDNYNGNENCVITDYNNWGSLWFDFPCSAILAFVCEADPITTCSSTLSACSSMPPVTSSLIGYYNGMSWDGSKWKDLSGANNHVTSVTGTVTVQSFNTISGLPALTGTTATAIQWPDTILPASYTLFHLSKYNGANKQRIISNVNAGTNWLSGHHNPIAGVAFHNAWITPSTFSYGNPDDWLLSSDQNALYRAQGVDLTIASPGSPSYTSPMAINKMSNQISDWAVATVLVYIRTLTGAEIEQVERWLYAIYFDSSSISSATKAYRLFPNCIAPTLQQQTEASALCAFKQGITNWPSRPPTRAPTPSPTASSGQSASPTSFPPTMYPTTSSTAFVGWDCNEATATSYPCGAAGTTVTWTGVTCTDGTSPNTGGVTQLDLNSMGLAGTISPSLSALTGLTELLLNQNSIYGQIPLQLSTLTTLYSLDLSLNRYLQTSIPIWLSALTALTNLLLNQNSIFGPIPTQLAILTNLQSLRLGGNDLTSSIPSQISTLTNLQLLDLSSNALTGSISSQLSTLINLKQLYLYSNKLTGAVGSSICIPSITTNNLLVGNNLFSCINPCVATKDSNACGATSYDCATPVTSACGAPNSCGAVMGDGYVGSTFPSCSRCAAGTYAVAYDESCTLCPANSFSVSGSGSCQCNNGYGQVGIGKTLSCTSLCSSNNQVFYSNTCPSGYTYYASTGSCYMYVSVAKTWSDANTACNSNGRGYLVTINSQTEDNLVYFTFGTGARWIGYNDQILEGTYVWAHGTSSYTNWYGVPDNLNNQDCISYYIGESWDDGPCTNSIPFVCEADPITTCSSTLSACSSMPPVTSSLIGYYNGMSWDGSKWKDLSGANNHVTSVTGTVTVQSFNTISGLPALTGTTATAMQWPNTVLPPSYTLFHLSKYNGANKQRIISSVSGGTNWYSGQYGYPNTPIAGVAYHNAWITQSISSYGNPDDWLLSSDQNALYRAQGVDLTIASPGFPSYTLPMGINRCSSNDVSDWAVATVLIYSRTLTGAEIEQVERWLYAIYFDSSSISSATKAYRLFPNCRLSGCPVCPNGTMYPSAVPTPSPSAAPTQLPTFAPTLSLQQSDANALCAFKQGITNWPSRPPARAPTPSPTASSGQSASPTSFPPTMYPTTSSTAFVGWDCNGATATSYPCGSGAVNWTGIACSTASSQVSQLDLNGKGLTGTISPSLSALNGLTLLQLSSNKLFGSIPPQISALISLNHLDLSNNELIDGEIPSQLSALTKLQVLDLHNNQLFGTIFSNQISAWAELISLDLSSNLLEGSIPSQLSILTNLQYLKLNSNELAVSIPSQLSKLTKLQQLYLSSNMLTGVVGSSICIPSIANNSLLIGSNSFSCINHCVTIKDSNTCGNNTYPCSGTPVTSDCGTPGALYTPTAVPTPSPTSQPSSQPSFQPSIHPSRQPTSNPSMQPTSTPTCISGHGPPDGSSKCHPCPVGEFGELGSCQPCPVGKYTDHEGSPECKECIAPYTNRQEGSAGCLMYILSSFDTSTVKSTSYSFVGFILLVLLAAIWLSMQDIKQLLVVIALMIFPSLDILSDIVYLATNLFYNEALFYTSLTVLCASSAGILKIVYDLKAWPQKFIVPYPLFYISPNLFWLTIKDKNMLINDKPALPFPNYDSLIIWAIVIVTFVFLATCQFFTAFVYLLWTAIHVLVVYPLMFLAAFFLYQTKLFSLSLVWNSWFFLWTGTMKHKKLGNFDVSLFNEALFFEFVTETLPQIVLQTINNVLIDDFTPIAKFSLVLSIVIAVDGVYQFLYYKLYLKTDIADVPLMFNLKVDTGLSEKDNSRSSSSNNVMMKDLSALISASVNAPHMKLQPLENMDSESTPLNNTVSLVGDKDYQLLLLLIWLQYNANVPHKEASLVMERLKKHKIVSMLELIESYHNNSLTNINMNRTHLSQIISAIEEALEGDISAATELAVVVEGTKRKVGGKGYNQSDLETASAISSPSTTNLNLDAKNKAKGNLKFDSIVPSSIDRMVHEGAVLLLYESGRLCRTIKISDEVPQSSNGSSGSSGSKHLGKKIKDEVMAAVRTGNFVVNPIMQQLDT